ncbi:MAG: hypothetical protein CMK09_04090 [Ponticaulis sp.]|nr:hypothetical protein [Ponticaulis sp.]|tara:strand:- start:34013 stop:35389 length:1377 start_codon:yes stop_codon:yes gene_type:complete
MITLMSGLLACSIPASADDDRYEAPLADGRRVMTDRELSLVHMAWYGDSFTFENTIRRLAMDRTYGDPVYGEDRYAFSTYTRGLRNRSLAAMEDEQCPLHMHVFYSFMSAPEGSEQLHDAAEKMAFMLHPYKRLVAREEAQQAASSPSEASGTPTAEEQAVIDNLNDTMGLIERLDPERAARMRAERIEREERHQRWLMHPRRSDAFTWVHANRDAWCRFEDKSISLPGYALPPEGGRLYSELARASIDERTAQRATAMIDLMLSMGEFDQEEYNNSLRYHLSRRQQERDRAIRVQQMIAERERAEAEALAEENRLAREEFLRRNPDWGNKDKQMQDLLGQMQQGLAVTVGRLDAGSSQYGGYDEGYYQALRELENRSRRDYMRSMGLDPGPDPYARGPSQSASGSGATNNSERPGACDDFDPIAYAEIHGPECLARHLCVADNSISSDGPGGATICN